MSDNEDATKDTDSDATTEEAESTGDLGSAGKKALAVERKARREAEKQFRAMEARLQEIEDRDKTDVQRLSDQVAALTKERDVYATEAMRLRVAARYGLSEEDLDFLHGETEDELDDRAKRYAERTTSKTSPPPPPPPSKPREQLKPGTGDPDTAEEETDLKKIGERMFSS